MQRKWKMMKTMKPMGALHSTLVFLTLLVQKVLASWVRRVPFYHPAYELNMTHAIS